MSSIDKYVEETARGLDKRVRVTNVNGRIVGRIDGHVVFDIADRYGLLNDSERAKIQRGVNQYLYTESEEYRLKKAAEEERIRKAEEARKKKLEEARQKAIGQAQSTILAKKKEAEAFYDNMDTTFGSRILVPPEIREAFDVSALVSSAEGDIASNGKSALNAIKASKETALKMLDSSLSAIGPETNTETAKLLVEQTKKVAFTFDASEYKAKNEKIIRSVNEILSLCGNVLQQVKALDAQYHSPITASLLARLKNVPIANVKDLKEVAKMVEAAVTELLEEQEREAMLKTLDELSSASDGLLALKLTADMGQGEQYEIPTFENEIAESKTRIIGIRQQLLSGDYTTLSTAQLVEVDQYLLSFENGEVVLKEGERIVNDLLTTATADARLRPEFEAFIRAKEDAESMGIAIDMKFDPFESDSQLESIAELVADRQIELAADELWNRAIATQALMDGLEWDLLGEKDENGMTTFVYAKKGLEGVVMQVDITEGGIRRKLVGIKTNGKETSVEAIRQAARKMEAEEEPRRFLEGYRTLFPTMVLSEDFGLADDEGIEDVIATHGVYDLDAEGKAETYSQIVGESVKDITRIEVVDYVPSSSQSIDVKIKSDAAAYRARKVQANKARYQKKS